MVPDAVLIKHAKVIKQIKKTKRKPVKIPILPQVRVEIKGNQNVLSIVRDEMKRKMVSDFIIKQFVKESLSCNYSDISKVANKWVQLKYFSTI